MFYTKAADKNFCMCAIYKAVFTLKQFLVGKKYSMLRVERTLYPNIYISKLDKDVVFKSSVKKRQTFGH